jgi:hypothetical protein
MLNELSTVLPEGTYANSYKGNVLVAFESHESRDPQFGFGKAKAIKKMAEAGMPAGTIAECMVWVGVYKMARVDPELMVASAKVLVDFVDALPPEIRNQANIWHKAA